MSSYDHKNTTHPYVHITKEYHSEYRAAVHIGGMSDFDVVIVFVVVFMVVALVKMLQNYLHSI